MLIQDAVQKPARMHGETPAAVWMPDAALVLMQDAMPVPGLLQMYGAMPVTGLIQMSGVVPVTALLHGAARPRLHFHHHHNPDCNLPYTHLRVMHLVRLPVPESAAGLRLPNLRLRSPHNLHPLPAHTDSVPFPCIPGTPCIFPRHNNVRFHIFLKSFPLLHPSSVSCTAAAFTFICLCLS